MLMMKFMKGLLLAASMLFAQWQTGDLSLSAIIVAVSFLIGYYAKNWWFPSVSTDGKLDWRDAASAVLVGISVAIPESISQIVVNGSIEWAELIQVVGAVFFVYITSTYVQKSNK